MGFARRVSEFGVSMRLALFEVGPFSMPIDRILTKRFRDRLLAPFQDERPRNTSSVRKTRKPIAPPTTLMALVRPVDTSRSGAGDALEVLVEHRAEF